MTRFILPLGLALLTGLAFAQSPGDKEEVIQLSNFKDCGFISRFAPNKINPECFQQLNNVVLDQDLSILRRNGYAQYTTSPCTGSQPIRGMWAFYATDGSQYIIFNSSGSMFSSKGDGLCSAIPGLSGLSLTATMSCTQGMGYLWCSNGTDPVFNTNVLTTNTVTQAPLGKYIGFFRNRIILAGVNGFLTNIFLSGELDGYDYTLPTVKYSTSPAILNISGTNDGLAVSCLMGEYQNGYYIGRQYDTYLLSGYDLRDFGIKKVDQQIGCMDNNSPQLVNNQLMWLSHRGVEGLSGTQINWLSYPIDPTIRVVIDAAGNSQAFTVNSANFTTGNLTASGAGAPISSTIYPGNLTPSSATFTDNSTTTFITGTLVNVSTAGSVLAASLSSATIYDGDFATGDNWQGYSAAGSTNAAIASAAHGSTVTINGVGYPVACPNNAPFCGVMASIGSLCPGASPSAYACLRNANGAIAFNYNTLNQTDYVIPLLGSDAVAVSTAMYLAFSQNPICSNPPLSGVTQLVQKYTTPKGFNEILDVNRYCGSGTASIYTFSNIRVSSYTSSGRYTSSTFDTRLSTPIIGVANLTISTNIYSNINFYQQNSDDGVSWVTTQTLTNGSAALSGKRYWRYLADFSTTFGTATATLGGLAPLQAVTTGYYITPCITAPGITSWSVLSVNAVENGGSFSFAMSTSAVSCAQVIDPKNANWTSVTANSIITVPVSSYTAVRVLFSVDSASQTPILNNISVNYNAGSSRPGVASAQYLNKYFMFYTTAQVAGAYNDHAVVYDQNGHWQLMDDVHAASASLYLNRLFIGDSQSTGLVYLFDSGSDDNGNPFTFSFTTPDLDGGDPISPKSFKRVYLLMAAPTSTTSGGAISCNYAINGSSTTYSLGTVNLSEATEQSGYFIGKLPFPSDAPTTGQWINMTCSNTGVVGPIRIYGIRLVYTKNDWP